MAIFKIIHPLSLEIVQTYLGSEKQRWVGPMGDFPQVEVPEGVDPDCVKAEPHEETVTIVDVPEQVIPAVLDEEGNVVTPEQTIPAVTHDEIHTVYTLVEDAALVTAKALSVKVAQCDALEKTLWEEILAEIEVVYGTKDMNSATAYYLTWRRMEEAPASFVGALFANEAAVIAYVTPKLAAADTFAVWRLGKIAACNAAKEAIMNA